MNSENKIQSITEAPTAQLNQHADEAAAIVAADKIQPTVTEYRTAGAERARKFKIFTAIGAAVLAVGALAHVTSPNKPAEHTVPETATYTAKPGDTLSQVAEQVAKNTSQKETTQEAATAIRDMNHLGQAPQLGIGQELQITTAADEDKKTPGIQLENTELPQPVVPEENGFNPNTPR
jgi:LysM repeat protein